MCRKKCSMYMYVIVFQISRYSQRAKFHWLLVFRQSKLLVNLSQVSRGSITRSVSRVQKNPQLVLSRVQRNLSIYKYLIYLDHEIHRSVSGISRKSRHNPFCLKSLETSAAPSVSCLERSLSPSRNPQLVPSQQ